MPSRVVHRPRSRRLVGLSPRCSFCSSNGPAVVTAGPFACLGGWLCLLGGARSGGWLFWLGRVWFGPGLWLWLGGVWLGPGFRPPASPRSAHCRNGWWCRVKDAPSSRRFAVAAPSLTRHHQPHGSFGSGRSRKDWTTLACRWVGTRPGSALPALFGGRFRCVEPVAVLVGGWGGGSLWVVRSGLVYCGH